MNSDEKEVARKLLTGILALETECNKHSVKECSNGVCPFDSLCTALMNGSVSTVGLFSVARKQIALLKEGGEE